LNVHILQLSNIHSRDLSNTKSKKMPSFRQVAVSAAVLGMGLVNALPSLPKMSPQMKRAYDFGVAARANMELEARQNPTTGLPDGLTDVDILEL
jgi:hypothetical protein